VARFTSHVLVLGIEHIARAGMVKVRTTLLGLGQACGTELQQSERQHYAQAGQSPLSPRAAQRGNKNF
jgi:hypothetical protein